jgi:hypothetical protein
LQEPMHARSIEPAHPVLPVKDARRVGGSGPCAPASLNRGSLQLPQPSWMHSAVRLDRPTSCKPGIGLAGGDQESAPRIPADAP